MMEERPQEKASSEDDERTNRCFFAWLSILAIIGGFLFGYDTGVISGAMILIKDDFTVTDSTQELIVSVTVGAAAIFALVGAFLNDRFGRKKVILTSSLIFSIGAVEMALAANVTELIIGRFIVGAGIGLSSMTVKSTIVDRAQQRVEIIVKVFRYR
uniref:Major facilitator superfamily (MFS) profile domain-containing protein n=1 Tax=Plectus sambesii TaxID=2011161 RepID=A0A914V4N6_9BILA